MKIAKSRQSRRIQLPYWFPPTTEALLFVLCKYNAVAERDGRSSGRTLANDFYRNSKCTKYVMTQRSSTPLSPRRSTRACAASPARAPDSRAPTPRPCRFSSLHLLSANLSEPVSAPPRPGFWRAPRLFALRTA